MATLREYRVRSVTLPADLGISRRFYTRKSHLPGVDALERRDYVGYETHTVFHDVFLSADGRSLLAIGPPLVNLRRQLFPATVTLINGANDQLLSSSVTISERDRICFFRFTLRRHLDPSEQHTVRIVLACDYAQELHLEPFTLSEVGLQVTTLQKDNPLPWIGDWTRYYADLGIERVLLYDNDSADFVALKEYLQSLDSPIEIVLVSWPFAYGPIRSFHNKFCQAGQNNHANQFLGQAAWCGHFDIDEYVVTGATVALVDYLRQQPFYVGVHCCPKQDRLSLVTR